MHCQKMRKIRGFCAEREMVPKIVKFENFAPTAVPAISPAEFQYFPSMPKNNVAGAPPHIDEELLEVLCTLMSKVREILPSLMGSSILVIKKTLVRSEQVQVARSILLRNIVMDARRALVARPVRALWILCELTNRFRASRNQLPTQQVAQRKVHRWTRTHQLAFQTGVLPSAGAFQYSPQ